MKTIRINASRSYEVKIGSGLLATLGSEAKNVTKAKNTVIVSDSNVWPLYGKAAGSSLEAAGFHVEAFVIPAGEASKNGRTYLELLEFLAEHRITRSDALIALGGGVVGDLTGFAAATFLRGISYIQVPTTLLAAVDSSVGGKTAIDLSAGKNLAGAFYQPSVVLCDTDTLDSLPADIFRDGCAEVIKYSILYDLPLFNYLSGTGLAFDREEVIAKCVDWKRIVVTEDEFDRGARQKLNLGHTVGHGVEAKSQFMLSHGCSVAVGMCIVARASASYGICSPETSAQIQTILRDFGLPTRTEYSAAELLDCALSDKKRSGNTVNLIVPECIGECAIRPMPIEELESFIKAGL